MFDWSLWMAGSLNYGKKLVVRKFVRNGPTDTDSKAVLVTCEKDFGLDRRLREVSICSMRILDSE